MENEVLDGCLKLTRNDNIFVNFDKVVLPNHILPDEVKSLARKTWSIFCTTHNIPDYIEL